MSGERAALGQAVDGPADSIAGRVVFLKLFGGKNKKRKDRD